MAHRKGNGGKRQPKKAPQRGVPQPPPEKSVDHIRPQCRGGKDNDNLALISGERHEARHTIFAALMLAETMSQLAWMENRLGNLSAEFMNAKLRKAAQVFFESETINGDDAWQKIIDLYGADTVREQVRIQLAGRSFDTVLASQIRKFRLLHPEVSAEEILEKVTNRLQKTSD